MRPPGTLLIKRGEVAELLDIGECIAAVERAFGLLAEGRVQRPGVLGVPARGGGFHIKAGLMGLGRSYFAAKVNANFPQNAARFGLPLVQGVIVLCDGENGYPLALLDSMEITVIRTGAATAVAAKHLARPGARVVTVCGCGNQGRVSLRAVSRVRGVEHAYAYDVDGDAARRFAGDLSAELGFEVEAAGDLAGAVGRSDICVTCTPSRRHFLKREHVPAGAFVAAVGADSEEKQEIDPELLAASKVVVDLLDQCASFGDLRHAIDEGVMTAADVHAELGEVVAGRKPGRASDEEVIVFDSTGTALQDVVAAATVYERALAAGRGVALDFAE